MASSNSSGLWLCPRTILEEVGGLPGNLVHGAARAKLVRVVEGVAEFRQVGLPGQFRHRDFVEHRFHTGKVGADADGVEGRDDEQGRGLQVDLVPEQLVHRTVKVGVAALELPAEAALKVGVGDPAGHRLFEGEYVLVAVVPGGGMAQDAADVQEHLLGRLFLAKVAAEPLGDECRGTHAGFAG